MRSQQGYVLWATFVGFGGLAHDASFPFGATLLSTLLIFAIPAQVLLIDGYGAGTPAAAIALGLLILTPISFLLALARNARDRVDVLSLIFGLALAPLLAVYGGTFGLLWTGLVGGTAAWAIHRLRKRRRK